MHKNRIIRFLRIIAQAALSLALLSSNLATAAMSYRAVIGINGNPITGDNVITFAPTSTDASKKVSPSLCRITCIHRNFLVELFQGFDNRKGTI